MSHRSLRNWLQVLGPFVVLSAIYLLFWSQLGDSGFGSDRHVRTLLVQTVITGIAALGMTFVIVSGGIDLSVGSVIALAAVVTARCIDHPEGFSWLWPWAEGPMPVVCAVLIGCGAGALCGFVNGLMITGLRIAPFVATLGMYGMARGMAKYVAAPSESVNPPRSWVSDVMAHSPEWYPEFWPEKLRLAPGVWLMLVLGLGMALLLRKTVFGVHTVAVGSSEPTARLCGVRVGRTKVGVYTLCGLCAGIAGVMLMGRLDQGSSTGAQGEELNVIAAVVIGGASLSGGEGSIFGALVGALLIGVLKSGCTYLEVENYVQDILIGAIIVAAVAVDSLRHRGSR